MQNRSSNDTNRALNNGVKKDIVQFHPLVSIIYLHIISRSRSIKGWSNHYHHYQYYTPLNQLYRRIATCIYNVYRRRWAIHGTTFRIIIRSEYKNLILRKGIIHEWNVSFNKRKKDTSLEKTGLQRFTYTLSLKCDTWSLIRNFYCVLRILHYEKKITRDKKKGVLQFFFFFFFFFSFFSTILSNQSIN